MVTWATIKPETINKYMCVATMSCKKKTAYKKRKVRSASGKHKIEGSKNAARNSKQEVVKRTRLALVPDG